MAGAGIAAGRENVASPDEIEANFSKMSENTVVKKRERRPNYTPEEKTYLAELVAQYQHIIEDKRTGGIFIKKKREAWRVITIKYNSNCTTGHRETEHLKTLYDNMKQQARKNDGECFTNTMTKLRLFQKLDVITNNNKDRETEEDVASEEKVPATTFSGRFYKRKSSDSDQVEPLSNPYDSAAVYFRDNNNHTNPPAIDPIQFLDVSLPGGARAGTRRDPLNNTPEHNSWDSSQPAASFALGSEAVRTVTPRKVKKPLSAELLKRLYYRKKCRNADLERRRLRQELAHAQQKHSLEMIILRRTLDKS